MNDHQASRDADLTYLLVTNHTIPVCGCGQDLDRVNGRHCPRCGVWLRAWCDR
jgi:hypothetical protein